jgi:putative PEP-CTERM system TPR-repeat lipoprotein
MNARAAFNNAVVAAGLCGLLAACGSGSPDALLASAKDYLANNDSKSAIIQLKNALEKNPDLGEARFLLGRTLLQSGDILAAEKELSRARDLKYPLGQVDPPLAVARVKMGEYRKVIDEMSQVQGATPRDTAELRTALGDAQLALGKPDLAKAAYAAAQAADAGYAPAMLGVAKLKAREGNAADAFAELERAIAADPAFVDTLQFKGDLLLAQNRVDDAIGVYRKEISTNPGYLPARWSLIAAFARAGDATEADKALVALKEIAPKHPRTYFYEALVRSQQKNFAAARDAIQQFAAVAPDDAPGMLLGASIDYELHAYDRAEAALVKMVQRTPSNDYARRLLVSTYVAMRQPDKALDALRPMLGRINSDAFMQNMAGEVYLLNGDAVEAAGHFEKAVALDPSVARPKARLALTKVVQGNTAAGAKELEAATAVDPDVRSEMMLISVALRDHHWDQALSAIASLEKKQPDKPTAPNLRGLALMGKNDVEGARKSFERALKLDPNFFPAVANLARIDLAQNNPKGAQKRFEDMLARDPNSVEALLALAEVRVREGAKPDEIVGLINRAIKANPTAIAPRLALMQHYMRAKEVKRAVAAGQDALTAIPGRPELLDAMGQAQQAAGDNAKALATFNRFAEVVPDSPIPYLRIASLHSANKEFDAAAQNFNRSLAIKPDLVEAQKGLVIVDVATGRIPEALTIAQNMQHQRSTEPVGYIIEGDIHAGKKDWTKALAAYKKAMNLGSGSMEAAAKSYAMLIASGQNGEAQKLADSWLQAHPSDDGFRFSMAEFAGRRKDYAGAMKYYGQILDKHPDNAVVLNNLALIAAQMKDPKAIEYAEKANSIAPGQASILDTLGTLLVAKGDTERGVSMLRQATQLAPDSPAIRLNLARALVKAGQKDAAKKELDELTKLGDKFGGHDEVNRLRKEI